MTEASDQHQDDALADLLKEVRHIEIQSKRLVSGVMSGGYSSVFRGSGIEFDEVREYVDGDDPRSVDWNVTARVGRPFVKKYRDERQLTVLFLLDLSASMSGGYGVWSARQAAARVCACLALSAIRNNDRVGLIAFSESVDKFVPAKRGIGHVLRIVRDCLALPPGGSGTDLGQALELASRMVRRRAILFLLSDFMSEGWRDAMLSCSRRHDLIAVRLLPPEIAPLDRGLMRLKDPEGTGRSLVDWNHRPTREAYVERVAQWRTRTDEDLRYANVDCIDIPLPRERDRDAIARPILAFYRMREERGAKR